MFTENYGTTYTSPFGSATDVGISNSPFLSTTVSHVSAKNTMGQECIVSPPWGVNLLRAMLFVTSNV